MVIPQVNQLQGLLHKVEQMRLSKFRYYFDLDNPFDNRITSDKRFDELMERQDGCIPLR